MKGSEASSAHFKSGEVEHSALDLFTVPPTNITYNGYRIVENNPTSESITPIEFVLPGSREYIDFSLYIYIDPTLDTAAKLLTRKMEILKNPNTSHGFKKQAIK